MDFKITLCFCVLLFLCSSTVNSKAVSKSGSTNLVTLVSEVIADEKKDENQETGNEGSGSGNDDDNSQLDCDPEKLKKCNIIFEKDKAVEKRFTCIGEKCKVECAEKRRNNCDRKKKSSKCHRRSHKHGVEKRCQTTECNKKKNERGCDYACAKKSSPLMERVFRFPAIMIAPIKSYNAPEKGLQTKKDNDANKRCGGGGGCGCGCGCCCCEPCCCCHECCCCPCCCCCCEPCCECCHCCHHCCQHCCPCCGCGCGCGCKKSKASAAAGQKGK